MKRMKRRVYRIQFVKVMSPDWKPGWHFRGPDASIVRRTKAEAIRDGVAHCRFLLELHIHSQLVIHTRDGRIQSERTYGADPRSRKG